MKTVGILAFDDVDLHTFADAVTVFSAAKPEVADAPPLFRTVLLAESMRDVRCESGFRLQPDATIQDHPRLDILLIPGSSGNICEWSHSVLSEWIEILVAPKGKGVRRERQNRPLLSWIREQSLQVELTIGICTGTVLLAESHLLNGRRAATHPELVDWMRTRYPLVRTDAEALLVDEGRILTAAGWNSAFQASLHAVAKFYGASTALSTAFRIDPRGKCLDPFGGAEGLVEMVTMEDRPLRTMQRN
jgi:transcriptional regulator GlxA family with amidase domain